MTMINLSSTQQDINGNRYGLPEIIGGSDLVVFSSRNIDTEEWILQVQEVRRRTWRTLFMVCAGHS